MKKARDFLKTLRESFPPRNLSSQMDAPKRYSYSPVLRWNPQVEDYFRRAYGDDRFARISEALTRPSCYSCIRVNTLRSTSDVLIEKLKKIMEDSDQSVVENGRICKCEIPGLDYVVFVKGSGPHVIQYSDEAERPPKEVLVSRKCAEAVLRGAQVFVPGVIACSSHVEKADTVAVSVAVEQPGSDGGWAIGITRGTVLQGMQTDPYHFERSGLYIGQGRAMLTRAGMFRVSEGVAVDMTNRVFRLPSFNDVLEGEVFLQNLPSIITAHALDPQKGERILDMCAAPGGKTTAIAILMKNEGEVIAVDRSHNKVQGIKKRAAEMGITCITTYKLDALKAVCRRNESSDVTTSFSSKKIEDVTDISLDGLKSHEDGVAHISTEALIGGANLLESATVLKVDGKAYASKADIRKNMRRLRNGPGRNQCLGGRVESSQGFLPNSFDRVLLDAPCSALGLRPRLFAGEDTVESLRNHGKYQKKMFDQAVQLVRPGGVIVYSTCTINPGENEALVRYALDRYKFLSLAPQHPRVGGAGIVGHSEFSDGSIEEWLRPGEEELVQRFDPSASLDTIGFFIAKFTVGSKDT